MSRPRWRTAGPPAVHPAQAPAAAAGCCLHEQGEADVPAGSHQVVDVVPRAGAREYRDAGRVRLLFGHHLVAGQGEDSGRGADEGDPRLFTRSGQLGVLGQETVARVNGVRPAVFGYFDQAADVEVGPERVAAFSYLVTFVGLLAVERVAVLVREDSDGRVAQLVDRPEGRDRDLTPVGDQHFAHRVERILQGGGRRGRPAGRLAGGRPAGFGGGRRAAWLAAGRRGSGGRRAARWRPPGLAVGGGRLRSGLPYWVKVRVFGCGRRNWLRFAAKVAPGCDQKRLSHPERAIVSQVAAII